MHDTPFISQEDARRHDVRARPDRNGLDYLEVSPDQVSLTVYFLGKAPPALLKGAEEDPVAYQKRLCQSVIIEGGERIRGIRVMEVDVRQARDSRTRRVRAELDDWMTVRVDRYGDFSTYTLRLVGLEGIDPFYDHVAFTFKAGCVSDLDCLPGEVCPPYAPEPVEIDYLAKDYASFRQLLLDRLSLTLPDWQERHVPDLGITLVELLAYMGDQLSYYQDAAATEAYLDTARQRISVRRHARLVDYRMHEGCNARAWLCLETGSNLTGEQALDPGQLFFITGLNDAQTENGRVLTSRDLLNLPPSSYEIFEPVLTEPLELYVAHQRIAFYTWGDRQSCLPAGATRATLRDPRTPPPTPPEKEPPAKGKRPPRGKEAAAAQAAQQQLKQQQSEPTPNEPPPDTGLHLAPGDVLIFEEVLGPVTGLAEDADPRHRHAVRLTRVTYSEDDLYQPPVPVVEIEWAAEDALPFALCLSAISGPANKCRYLEDISVACGNVILVDHGHSLDWEDLGVVECESELAECDCQDRVADRAFLPARYRPWLAQSPVTFRAPYPTPAQVASQQARALAGLLDQVHNRVVALWQQTLRGAPLNAREIEELAAIFGSQAIHEAGGAAKPSWQPSRPAPFRICWAVKPACCRAKRGAFPFCWPAPRPVSCRCRPNRRSASCSARRSPAK
jgi:predicted phage baseplate assembly protein